jgi:proton glutamate symport protein
VDLSLERFSFGRWLTIATLAGLAAGVVAGTLVPAEPGGILGQGSTVLEAVGAAWVRGLRMTVIPLVAGLIVVAVLDLPDGGGLAKLGGAAVGIFFLLYTAFATVATLLYPPLVRALGVSRGALASMPVEAPPESMVATHGLHPVEWLVDALPTNPFSAAVEENILQVVVFGILFAVAAGRLAPEARARIAALFTPLADAMLVLVALLLKLSPVAVFALGFGAAREVGFSAAWILLVYALVTSIIMFLLTLGLLPVAGVLGRVGTVRFARAAWPGQLVGFATRSSLAALPALVEGARYRLGLPDRVVGFGLPLAASVFKPNSLVSAPGRVLFVGWVFDVAVDPMSYVAFMLTMMVLASATPGIPSQSGRVSALPFYVAMGLPLEGVMLLEAVDVLWDFFATVFNATGYLAATTLLPRGTAAPRPADTP